MKIASSMSSRILRCFGGITVVMVMLAFVSYICLRIRYPERVISDMQMAEYVPDYMPEWMSVESFSWHPDDAIDSISQDNRKLLDMAMHPIARIDHFFTGTCLRFADAEKRNDAEFQTKPPKYHRILVL